MKLERCVITFNGEESLEFLIDTNKNSFEEIQEVLDEYKETEEYLSNDWDSSTIEDLLESNDIGIINLSDMDVSYHFELPEPDEDDD